MKESCREPAVGPGPVTQPQDRPPTPAFRTREHAEVTPTAAGVGAAEALPWAGTCRNLLCDSASHAVPHGWGGRTCSQDGRCPLQRDVSGRRTRVRQTLRGSATATATSTSAAATTTSESTGRETADRHQLPLLPGNATSERQVVKMSKKISAIKKQLGQKSQYGPLSFIIVVRTA